MLVAGRAAALDGCGHAPAFSRRFWLELTLVGIAAFGGVAYVVWDAFCTVRWARTPGKAVLGLRVLKVDGCRVGWGTALLRAFVAWAAGLLLWVGLLDCLWCLWDAERQCIHDKAASTIVVHD